MRQMKKSILALFLVMVMVLGNVAGVFAVTDKASIDQAVMDTAKYMQKKVVNPQVGSVGGEWAIISLSRSSYEMPQSYYDNYYKVVEEYVKECKGILHEKKYTDYSRVTVALSAIGKDPRNVAGYNLLTPLGDFKKTIWQGINGPIWALIALDTKNYPMPQNKDAEVQATRDMYVDEILSRQLPDGGFSLTGGTTASSKEDESADPDLTGMALQALAKYQDRADVKVATDKAVACLSKIQDENGGYSSWGTTNSESVDQVIVALTELGISIDDPRFIKNGHTLKENLFQFGVNGGGFKHILSSTVNQMATEQGLYTLAAMQRALNGENSLYCMSDVKVKEDAIVNDNSSNVPDDSVKGLANKNADVKVMKVVNKDRTFADVASHKNQKAIEALASRNIINGKTDTTFDPDATMTRAEFATIVVKALGLSPKADNTFADVSSKKWYAGYVGTAYKSKIVTGTSATTFNPNGEITRQEAAIMVARAAALCGMDTKLDGTTIQDTLAQFTDYLDAATWAKDSLAFCYSNDILNQSDLEILPKTKIKRCEISEMLYCMLDKAELI